MENSGSAWVSELGNRGVPAVCRQRGDCSRALTDGAVASEAVHRRAEHPAKLRTKRYKETVECC